jgi:predicted amidohydrolase YtcJ
MDDAVGRLEPGMLADLTILADNPLRVPVAQLSKIENDATIMDGKIVFDRHKLFG